MAFHVKKKGKKTAGWPKKKTFEQGGQRGGQASISGGRGTGKIHNVIQNKQFMCITYYYKCF